MRGKVNKKLVLNKKHQVTGAFFLLILTTNPIMNAILPFSSMVKIMKSSVFIDVVAFLFVLLFVYTATSKFLDFTLFREQIADNAFLAPFAKIIVWFVPLSEIVISIMLLSPNWRIRGLYLALGLMVVFTTYIILIMNFSKHIPCSCGGIISTLSWREHVIFNSAFMLLGILAILVSRHHAPFFGSSNSNLKHR